MPKVDLLSPEAALFPGPLVERGGEAPEWSEGEEEGGDLASADVESGESGGGGRCEGGYSATRGGRTHLAEVTNIFFPPKHAVSLDLDFGGCQVE